MSVSNISECPKYFILFKIVRQEEEKREKYTWKQNKEKGGVGFSDRMLCSSSRDK